MQLPCGEGQSAIFIKFASAGKKMANKSGSQGNLPAYENNFIAGI